MPDVGGMIAKVRKERGMSQSELAEKVKCTKQTISNYERGVRNPESLPRALAQLNDLRDTYQLRDVYGYYATEAEARASEHGAYLDGHVHARRELSKDGSLVSLYAEGYDLYAEEIEGNAPIDDPAAWEDADITPVIVADWGYEPLI